jgi:hypothetical protein
MEEGHLVSCYLPLERHAEYGIRKTQAREFQMVRPELYRLAASVSFIAALAGCGGADGPVELAFARVAGLASGLLATWPAGSYQARSAGAWQAIWVLQQTFGTPPSPVPLVDFGHDMVVGVSEGLGSSGCDSLSITHVTESDTEVEVDYVRTGLHFDPAHPVACAAVVVPLVDFVTIKQSDKPVRFVRFES